MVPLNPLQGNHFLKAQYTQIVYMWTTEKNIVKNQTYYYILKNGLNNAFQTIYNQKADKN